jgi:hypothetical protein
MASQVFYLIPFLDFGTRLIEKYLDGCRYNSPMSFVKARRSFGILLFLSSLAILTWSVWPAPSASHTVRLSLSQALVQGDGAVPVSGGSTLEDRQLTLVWPSAIRSGEIGTVRLVLEAISPQSVSALPGEVDAATGAGGDLYTTHNVLVEARLEMPGMLYSPSGEVSQALPAGQPVTFLWSGRASQQGDYQGTIWLHLRLIPLGAGRQFRTVLSAQRIEIKASSLLGMSEGMALVMGSLGLIIGFGLFLNGLLDWTARFLARWKRDVER